mgnify:CR=1 FL=1
MDANSFLHDEIILHEEKLAIEGIPHIDYTCTYEHVDRDAIIKIIKNSKKFILWNQGKFKEIEQFDHLYAEYIHEICIELNVK